MSDNITATSSSTTEQTTYAVCNEDFLNSFKEVKLVSIPICKYTDFEQRRLIFADPEKRKFVDKKTGEDVVYFTVAIKYEYGTDTSNIKPFILQGPKEIANYGISAPKKKDDDGKVQAPGGAPVSESDVEKLTVGSKLDMKNPEHITYADVMCKLYVSLAIHLEKYRGLLKMYSLDASNPDTIGPNRMVSGIKYPIIFKRDEQTGKVIESEDPTIYYKVPQWTVFTTFGKEVRQIPIDALRISKFSYYGLYDINSAYIGGAGPNVSIQFKTRNGIILDMSTRGGGTAQIDMLSSLAKEEDSSRELCSQLEQIMKTMAKTPKTSTTNALGNVEASPQAAPIVKPDSLQNYQAQVPPQAYQAPPQGYQAQVPPQGYQTQVPPQAYQSQTYQSPQAQVSQMQPPQMQQLTPEQQQQLYAMQQAQAQASQIPNY